MSTEAWAWEGHPGRRVFEDRRLQNSLGVLASLMSETDHRKGQLVPSAASGAVLDRRSSALTHANEVRVARAKLKQELREGTVCIGPILAAPPEHVSTAKVLDLLVAVPEVGPVKAARLLNKAGVGQIKTVGGLTNRQRAQLIELPPRVPRGNEAVSRGRTVCGTTLARDDLCERLVDCGASG